MGVPGLQRYQSKSTLCYSQGLQTNLYNSCAGILAVLSVALDLCACRYGSIPASDTPRAQICVFSA